MRIQPPHTPKKVQLVILPKLPGYVAQVWSVISGYKAANRYIDIHFKNEVGAQKGAASVAGSIGRNPQILPRQ